MRHPTTRLWLFAMGLLLGTSTWAATGATTGSCLVGCDQTLVTCEHQLGGNNGRCGRKHASCAQLCTDRKATEHRSPKQQKRILCTQRCDLSRSSCEQANSNDGAYCAAGQKSCIKRCK